VHSYGTERALTECSGGRQKPVVENGESNQTTNRNKIQINKHANFEPLDQYPTPPVSYVVFVRHAMPWSGRWLLVEGPDACYVLGRIECGAQIIKFFIFIILFEKKIVFCKNKCPSQNVASIYLLLCHRLALPDVTYHHLDRRMTSTINLAEGCLVNDSWRYIANWFGRRFMPGVERTRMRCTFIFFKLLI